jgi:hypothetical protein
MGVFLMSSLLLKSKTPLLLGGEKADHSSSKFQKQTRNLNVKNRNNHYIPQ